ncbi:hypothetical protein [Haloplanus aerogenes]|nr:hypothetical protein [Haloplanus aerogenes]AZH25371.1 hypothetical protein DU502_08250 [Haloplanus aerogenes]
MSLDIPAVLEDGFSRLLTRVAGLLLVAYLVVGVISTVTAQTLSLAVFDAFRSSLPSDAATTPTTPGMGGNALALDVGLPVAIALFLAQIVLAQIVGIVGIRTFVSEARRSFPTGVARNLPWVVLNALVAGFIVNVLIGIGTILLVIPGIYLAVALYFVQFEVIVEERNAIDALRTGWELTKGERLGVFLLLLVIFAIGIATAVPSIVLGFVGAPTVVVVLVSVVVGAVAGVIGVAIGARAYVQLKPDGWSSPGGGADARFHRAPRS